MNEEIRIYITKNAIYCKSIKYGTKYRLCNDRKAFCTVDRIIIDDLLETFIDTCPTYKLLSGVAF